MTNMRAKVTVSNIEVFRDGDGKVTQENLTFKAVCANKYTEDGSDENNTYAKFTPSAEFKLSVLNPNLFGKFVLNNEYYVDFTPVKSEED